MPLLLLDHLYSLQQTRTQIRYMPLPWLPTNHKLIISRHLRFHEHVFLLATHTPTPPITSNLYRKHASPPHILPSTNELTTSNQPATRHNPPPFSLPSHQSDTHIQYQRRHPTHILPNPLPLLPTPTLYTPPSPPTHLPTRPPTIPPLPYQRFQHPNTIPTPPPTTYHQPTSSPHPHPFSHPTKPPRKSPHPTNIHSPMIKRSKSNTPTTSLNLSLNTSNPTTYLQASTNPHWK